MRQTTNSVAKLRWITFGLIVVFILLIISFLRVFLKDYELRQQIARVQQDVNKMEKRKIESLEVLKRLQSDAYVEDKARAELQAAKPGEAVIVVPGLSVTSTAPTNLHIQVDEPKPLSNPEKWWYYFFRPQSLKQ